MVGWEIQVNGKRVCTAGLADKGALTMMLASFLDQDMARPTFDVRGFLDDKGEGVAFMVWIKEKLKLGDAIMIRMVEVAEIDEPMERWREANALIDKGIMDMLKT